MGLWSGVILNSSLTYKGGLIPWRTKELTYIGGPGTKGLPGPWCELSGLRRRSSRGRPAGAAGRKVWRKNPKRGSVCAAVRLAVIHAQPNESKQVTAADSKCVYV